MRLSNKLSRILSATSITLVYIFIIFTSKFATSKPDEPCTKIISKSVIQNYKLVPHYKDLENALDKYKAGDIICLSDGNAKNISIFDFNGGKKYLTIRPLNYLSTVIANKKYSGTGITIKGSTGIIIKGLIVTGGLFAIKIVDSSNIKLSSNLIFNVGNEAILINPKAYGGMNYLINDNIIFDTG
ncbi:MAG: parallel beta-helix repeat protein, partial [Alteromonadaceae bacterium]